MYTISTVKTYASSVTHLHGVIKVTEGLFFFISGYLALNLTISRHAFCMVFHPVEQCGQLLLGVVELIWRSIAWILSDERCVFISPWKCISGDYDLLPELDILTHFFSLFIGYDMICILEDGPIYVLNLWCILQPQKAMNMPTATYFPLIAIPEVPDTK